MATVSVRKVAFMLRVHRRSEWLPLIYKQMRAVAKGRQAHLFIMADRPSASVAAAVNKIVGNLPDSWDVTVLECPGAIRTHLGCRWTETMKFMYAKVKQDEEIDAAMLWDDDILFSDMAIKELRAHLHFFEYDRIEANWLNLVDEEGEQYDSGFLNHSGTHLFRVYAEDDWSDVLTRTTGGGGTQSPIFAARSQNFVTMDGKVLHMGYCSEDKRQEAWNAAKACGQYDGYFRHLRKPPVPKKCVGPKMTSSTLSLTRK